MMASPQIQNLPADYAPPLDMLTNRVILLTGAAAGIGRALARALAGYGATVILLDKNLRQLEAVYDEIENGGGPQPALYPLNLETATPDHYEELKAALEQNFGRLDALIHNAAMLGRPAPLEQYDLKAWFSTLQTNLTGPLLLTQACLPLLKQAEQPSIIFSADEVGRRGKAYWGAYGVSKFGVEGMMQILAAELDNSTPVKVNSLDPGPARTGLRRSAYPGENAGQLRDPEDLVGAYLYLLGPDGRHLQGQSLRIDEPTADTM